MRTVKFIGVSTLILLVCDVHYTAEFTTLSTMHMYAN